MVARLDAKDPPRVPVLIRAAPPDTPKAWLDRLARAYADGRTDADEARRRLDAYARGRDEKTARWMRYRLDFLMANALPRDAPQIVAGCVREVEARFGGLLPYVPVWIQSTRNRDTARIYARLYFFALALGWRGRDFEMAQSLTARLFGIQSAGLVAEFMRKAVSRGFVEIVSRGRPHGNGARGRGTVYRLIHRDGHTVGDAAGFLYGLLMERMPCIASR